METEDGKIYAEYRWCSNQLRRLTRKATKISLNRTLKPFGNMSALGKKNPGYSLQWWWRPGIYDKKWPREGRHTGDFFSSVFTNEPEGTRELPNRPEFRYRLKLSITTESLIKKLDKLKISKSPGPDGMHPRVLSELRTVLVSPLLVIFQTSVRTGSLPAAWKDANTSAIHKKGNKHIAGNYRPVSLTSIVCKLLESL